MREALAFLLLACACGAATWSGRRTDVQGPSPHRTDDDERSAAPGSDAAEPGPNGVVGSRERDRGFASLEALAASLAPGMRQTAERETGGERTELVPAGGKDTCLRVAFEAAAPVLAKLLDAEGIVLAETRSPATTGVLGERGPLCVRKTESVSAAAEGTGGRVRWIAWASP